eukprot:3880487-Rhodomonas_salina.1
MGATGSKDKLAGSASIGGMAGTAAPGGMSGGEAQSPELKCAVPIAFRWHHGAQREVYVVGSFSNWQTKIRLTREPGATPLALILSLLFSLAAPLALSHLQLSCSNHASAHLTRCCAPRRLGPRAGHVLNRRADRAWDPPVQVHR